MLQRRILHIFPSFEAGGQQARVCTILNALGSRFSHSILAGQGRHEAAAMLSPSVKVDLLPALPGKGSLFYPLGFRNLIRKVRPDLVLTYNWGAFDGVLGAWLAAACPVIHAEDGFGSDEAEGLKSRRVWSRRIFLNRISGVVVPSRTLADVARNRFRIRPDLVRWIPNGIDTQRFAPARNESLRRAWGVRPNEVLFGFVGRLGEEKNLDAAIRAMARTSTPGVRFVVIGDGPCRTALHSLAAELGLGTRVIFAGASSDVAPVYGALDAFLLSSRTEQMPMSLLEAMACGLPAVCADVGDCGEMLGTRKPPYLVPRRNVEALASALSVMAAEPRLRADAGARNRERVETQYSLGKMLAAYERIYETGSVSAA